MSDDRGNRDDAMTDQDNLSPALSGQPSTPAPQPDMGSSSAPIPSLAAPSTGGGIGAGENLGIPTKGAQQPEQHPWQRILMGALVGMAGGAGAKNFGQGLAGGAKASVEYGQQQTENRQRQEQIDTQKQETQHRIKFMDAQSASMAADAALKDAHLHALPQQLQDAHDANALDQVKTLQGMGITPTLVVANNKGGAEATAGLQQMTDSHGGVPAMHYVVMGKQVMAYDLNQLTGQPQTLGEVNKIRSVTGQPELTPGQWATMPQAAKNQQADSALGFWAPSLSQQNLMQYKNYLATAKQADPKSENTAKLQKVVDGMQSGLKSIDQHDLNMTGAKTEQNMQAMRKMQNMDINEAADNLVNNPNNLTQLSGLASMRGDERMRLYNAANRIAKAQGKTFDPGITDRRVKFLDGYQDPKGRAAINRQAINNVAQHAADLNDINEEYTRTGLKFANIPLNKLKSQNSDVYTRYETVSSVLKDELSLYFAGGYAPNKDQLDTWNKIQSGDATMGQTTSFAKEVISLASRRASTFNSQYKSVMGYDDPSMISPDALASAHRLGVKDLDKFGSGGQMGVPGSGGGGKTTTPGGGKPNLELLQKHGGQ